MNRLFRWGAALLLLAAMPSLAANPKTMSIQVRQGELRSAPSYLSRVVTTLAYTTRVTVLEERGEWLRVSPVESTEEGWVHAAALTEKKLVLKSGDADATTAVSSDEQALAGKGFNSDVEAKFKENNKTIDFTWVDKMGKITIPSAALVQFLNEGAVKPSTGGAR